MLRGYELRVVHKYLELIAVILSLSLLPVDRFPYLHYVPLKLGAVSFILLLLAAGIRLAGVVGQKRWDDLKRIALPAVLLLLPVTAYAQSIHYAIDKPYAKGATKLLLVVALKALCFFVLLYENRGLWKVVKNTVYGVTAIIVVFGFFQFIFDVLGASPRITDLRPCCTSNSTYIFPRVHSVALEPLYFANFLLLPLWLMVHDFIFNKAARRNKALLILLAATSSLFILSLARSALLGLLVSALVFMVGLGGSSLKKAAPHVLRGAGLILIIALGFIILSGVASKHIHKTAINGSTSGVKGNLGIFGSHAVSVADESAQTRYSTWPKAIDYFKENPIKGVGAYNSRVRLNLEQYRKGVPDINLQPFNNDFLGLLVDLGLIGVLAFGPLVAGLLVSLVKSLKRHWSTPSAAYALASLAMLIQTNFFQSILLARLWVVAGIALAGIYRLPAKRKAST